MEQGGVFRECVADGAAEPADELEAVLGGPLGRLDECWQHQTLDRAELGGLVGALLPTEVLGPVGDVAPQPVRLPGVEPRAIRTRADARDDRRQSWALGGRGEAGDAGRRAAEPAELVRIHVGAGAQVGRDALAIGDGASGGERSAVREALVEDQPLRPSRRIGIGQMRDREGAEHPAFLDEV